MNEMGMVGLSGDIPNSRIAHRKLANKWDHEVEIDEAEVKIEQVYESWTRSLIHGRISTENKTQIETMPFSCGFPGWVTSWIRESHGT